MGVMQMRPSSPALWEESIDRRGQHVLWYSAAACFCMSDNGRVDPNCPRCYGKGFTYSPVRSTRRIVWGVTDGKATLDLTSMRIHIKSINRVFLAADQEIVIQSFTPTSITPAVQIKKGIRFTLDYEESFENSYSGACTYIGRGLVDVPIRLVNNQNYFAGALVEVAALQNVTKGKSMKIDAIWGNKILTSDACDETDELTVSCTYLKAAKFLITSINPKSKIENNMVLQQADAMMSFPGTFHIGRGDVIVLQMAEMKETMIGYNEGNSFVFPFQSIATILHIEDKYGEITDFTLVRENEIVWGARKPDRFSCTFTYHPAFTVLDDLPTVRYSENKIWPKRVFLKKFSTFTHSSRVLSLENTDANVQEIGLRDDPLKSEEQGGLI
jgi:hypothetical protein